MGLGKEKGSSRINRYEHQVTAIGFDNLDKLAGVLDVPVAYLLADSAPMADAILELGKASPCQQTDLVLALKGLNATPALSKVLLNVLRLGKQDQEQLIKMLLTRHAEQDERGGNP